MYEYRARPVDVIDGDTIDVTIDLGFSTYRRTRLRLKGLDTAEIYGTDEDSDEYEEGQRHAAFVREWLPRSGRWPLVVRTQKQGKYGRYIAEVERREDGNVLNDALRRQFDVGTTED